MRIKSFGYNMLEHPFSEVEIDSNLQKISKLRSPSQKKKRITNKKVIVITMEEKNEKK
jgi:hypothetical protein